MIVGNRIKIKKVKELTNLMPKQIHALCYMDLFPKPEIEDNIKLWHLYDIESWIKDKRFDFSRLIMQLQGEIKDQEYLIEQYKIDLEQKNNLLKKTRDLIQALYNSTYRAYL